MAGRAFVDTNVLVYSFDEGEPEKRTQAEETLGALAPGDLVLSTQVLQEFYSTATRKLRMAPEGAAMAVASLAKNPCVVVDPTMILAAAKRSMSDSLNFWDALIVEAALSGGCDRLLTEDLQHGRKFGNLVVENPFAP